MSKFKQYLRQALNEQSSTVIDDPEAPDPDYYPFQERPGDPGWTIPPDWYEVPENLTPIQLEKWYEWQKKQQREYDLQRMPTKDWWWDERGITPVFEQLKGGRPQGGYRKALNEAPEIPEGKPWTWDYPHRDGAVPGVTLTPMSDEIRCLLFPSTCPVVINPGTVVPQDPNEGDPMIRPGQPGQWIPGHPYAPYGEKWIYT